MQESMQINRGIAGGCAALLCVWVLIAIGHMGAFSFSGTTLRVAQFDTSTARDPSLWAGHTVLLSGIAEEGVVAFAGAGMQRTMRPSVVLVDADPRGNATPVALLAGDPAPLRTWLGQLPLIGKLISGPQQVLRWGVTATYRVRLHAIRCTDGSGSCADAVLLDAWL